jgi:hypothetical protein
MRNGLRDILAKFDSSLYNQMSESLETNMCVRAERWDDGIVFKLPGGKMIHYGEKDDLVTVIGQILFAFGILLVEDPIPPESPESKNDTSTS